eukprot:scaffold17021_cov64-Phaeocystis_antarctica.AAC.3
MPPYRGLLRPCCPSPILSARISGLRTGIAFNAARAASLVRRPLGALAEMSTPSPLLASTKLTIGTLAPRTNSTRPSSASPRFLWQYSSTRLSGTMADEQPATLTCTSRSDSGSARPVVLEPKRVGWADRPRLRCTSRATRDATRSRAQLSASVGIASSARRSSWVWSSEGLDTAGRGGARQASEPLQQSASRDISSSERRHLGALLKLGGTSKSVG